MADDDKIYCPACDSEVPADAKKCPECGAEFDNEIDEVVIEKGDKEKYAEELEDERGAGEEPEALVEEAPRPKPRKAPKPHRARSKAGRLTRDRVLFYAGISLIMVGGPGLAFGSWLHDALEVPIVGDSYSVFGSINVMFAIVGALLFIIGMVALVLSLKGGVLTPEELGQARSEG